jgi:hypothetical protein
MLSRISPIENLILGISSIMLIKIFSKHYWLNKNKKGASNDKVIVNKIMVDLETNNIVSLDKDFELDIQNILKDSGITKVRIYHKDEYLNDDFFKNRINFEYKDYLTDVGKERMITKIFMG